MSSEGYYDSYVNKWGTNSSWIYAVEEGYFAPAAEQDMLADGVKAIGGLSRTSKSFKPAFAPRATSATSEISSTKPSRNPSVQAKAIGSLNQSIKNPWNQFLNANKGRYSGANWIKQARQDYQQWKLSQP